MNLFLFLFVVQAIVAFALVLVVLMQRSEGGGLGIGGGGPGGLMSARGAADFLTRTTKWLAIMFVVLSIALAAVAIDATSGREIDESLDRSVTPSSNVATDLLQEGQAPAADPAAPAPETEPPADPLADVAQ